MNATLTPIQDRENQRQIVSLKGREPFFTPLSDREAAEYLKRNRSEFARSLLASYNAYSLKGDGVYWFHRLALDEALKEEQRRSSRPEPSQESSVRSDRIREIFDFAKSHKKFPKVELRTASGGVVVLKLAGPRSKYAGCILVTDDAGYPHNRFFGLIDAHGFWKPGRDAESSVTGLLEAFDADPAGVAKVQGQSYSRCCFCGLELTDQRSLDAGYGPICAGHHGLPWG